MAKVKKKKWTKSKSHIRWERRERMLSRFHRLADKLHEAANNCEDIRNELDEALETKSIKWIHSPQGERTRERADALEELSMQLDELADKVEDL